MPRALVVDDDRTSLAAFAELIQLNGFTATTAPTLGEARARLAEATPDVVLTDLVLPDGSGLELLDETAAVGAQVVLITGHASVDTAVEALRRGAVDYLTKPLDVARLKSILANVARTRELHQEVGALRGALRKLGRFGPLVGASASMAQVYDLIDKVAPTDATVCIIGESGTGKEVVAAAVHQLSRRRRGPFVPVNCGAVAPSLMETTLFGHEKGSFTGAERLHRGVFEQAAEGTLFLDEVTEMPHELQVKLLRVLETGTLMRVGGEQPVAVDVRVLVATNRVPEVAVTAGKLRDDLWYRLKVFPVVLPPLRERTGDLEMLAEHFLEELNAVHGTAKRWTTAALERLGGYGWPGNVRELKNLVHRAFILADAELTPACIPAEITAGAQSHGSGTPTYGSVRSAEPVLLDEVLSVHVGSSIDEVERTLIFATLEACGGNKQKAAEILGVSHKTLYNRLTAYKHRASSDGTRRRPTAPPCASRI